MPTEISTSCPAQHSSRLRWDHWGYIFIAPWVIGFLIFTAGPMLASVVLSLTDYDLASARFVGGRNYAELIWQTNASGGHGDERFWQSLWNTFYYTLFAVPLGLTGSLLLAVLLNQKLKALPLFRTVYYLPSLVPAVASSLLWIWILQPEVGLLNQFLRWLFETWPFQQLQAVITVVLHTDKPFAFHPPKWLASEDWSKPSLILMSLWGIGGSRMIIFLAGLQGIGDQYYEAATIDGAGAWGKFRHVTLPLITPIIFFNLVLGVIGAFQTFTQAYIMTGGGPNDSTLLYALYLYRMAFEWFQMGKASAMAWILFVILLVFTYIQFSRSRKWVHYEGGGDE
jgi:multiple sugar transport system permease protein